MNGDGKHGSIKVKAFWKSKTFWGAIIAALPIPAAPIIAVAVQALPDIGTTASTEDPVVTLVQGAISILGAVIVIYGRYKADMPITFR